MSFGEIPQPKKLSVDPTELEVPETKESKAPVSAELSPDEILQILLDVQARIIKDPNTELTQLEASLVYQVDKDLLKDELNKAADAVKIMRIGAYSSMTDTEISQRPDFEQIKSLIKERLTGEKNVIQTSKALEQVMDGLEVGGYKPEAYVHVLKEKMQEWEERGVFDYLTIELIKNNIRHNIVPVPNAEFGAKEIFTLARKFGEGQPHPIEGDVGDILISRYSPTELSGRITNPVQPIRLSLIPSKFNPEFGVQTTEHQKAILQTLQSSNPDLNFQVPSLLSSVVHWYILRAQGDKLAPADPYNYDRQGKFIFNKTYVRQFNLQPKEVKERFREPGFAVPSCRVSEDGAPILFINGGTTAEYGARVAVG